MLRSTVRVAHIQAVPDTFGREQDSGLHSFLYWREFTDPSLVRGSPLGLGLPDPWKCLKEHWGQNLDTLGPSTITVQILSS